MSKKLRSPWSLPVFTELDLFAVSYVLVLAVAFGWSQDVLFPKHYWLNPSDLEESLPHLFIWLVSLLFALAVYHVFSARVMWRVEKIFVLLVIFATMLFLALVALDQVAYAPDADTLVGIIWVYLHFLNVLWLGLLIVSVLRGDKHILSYMMVPVAESNLTILLTAYASALAFVCVVIIFVQPLLTTLGILLGVVVTVAHVVTAPLGASFSQSRWVPRKTHTVIILLGLPVVLVVALAVFV